MRIARIAAVAGVVGLAGCSVGTAPGAGAVSGNYKPQTNYQDAYRYATVQAERCLVGQGGYRVVGELDDNARTGLVRVVAPFFDGEMARVEIGAIDAHSSTSISACGARASGIPTLARHARSGRVRSAVLRRPICRAIPAPTEEVWRLPNR